VTGRDRAQHPIPDQAREGQRDGEPLARLEQQPVVLEPEREREAWRREPLLEDDLGRAGAGGVAEGTSAGLLAAAAVTGVAAVTSWLEGRVPGA
jgi:hypothetical protein